MESARKKKRKLPDWYLAQPPIPEQAVFFNRAYRDLTTCRHPEAAIPWTATMLYAERKGLDNFNTDLLWSVIRKMDMVERRWHIDNLKETSSGHVSD